MRICLLGPIEIHVDGETTPIGGSKILTVLAALLLSKDQVVSDATLSELLWRGAPPSTSSAQIQTYVSRLRNVLGTEVELLRQRHGYLLRAPAVWTDVDEFHRLAEDGHKSLAEARYAEAAGCFRDALALWRGPALTGATEFLVDVESPRLDETRLTVTEALLEAELALGNHQRAVAELAGLVAAHPFREPLRGHLMVALYRCGRQAEALSTYLEFRGLLAEELGVDPSAELVELYQAVLRNDPALASVSVVPVEPLAPHGPPAQLPPDTPDFTGRADQVTRLSNLLEGGGVRIVTGMPGVGKTALALRVAHRLRDRFPDGQLHADLAGSSHDPVPPAEALSRLLRSVGVTDPPASLDERTHVFRQYLSGRRMLLVLDDVADERQVRPLLPGDLRCGVVLTSRSRLAGLEARNRIRLTAFTPEEAREHLESVLGPDRVVDHLAAVRRLLEFTGRLPLAVRIVAARLAACPHTSVAHLASRLMSLSELRLGDLDVTARIGQSYHKLSPTRRQALRLLALGELHSFSMWRAAVMLDQPLGTTHDLLEDLADSHLLEVGWVGRRESYTIPSLVRAYARERIFAEEDPGERGAVLERIHQTFQGQSSIADAEFVRPLRVR